MKPTGHPRTQAAKKAYFDALEQGVKVRAKRNPNNLPCSWTGDHGPKPDRRNWKQYRGAQYKAAA